MNRPVLSRLGIAAALGLPAVLLLLVTAHADAQGDGAIVWYCSKCNRPVGSGPNPPSYCHHCKSRLIGRAPGTGWSQRPSSGRSAEPPAQQQNPALKWIVVVGVGLALVGLGAVVMKAQQ
jgi:hypothetical protein